MMGAREDDANDHGKMKTRITTMLMLMKMRTNLVMKKKTMVPVMVMRSTTFLKTVGTRPCYKSTAVLHILV